MPCDVWKQLAQKAKYNRQQFAYFAYGTSTGVSESKKKQLMKEHKREWETANRDAGTHRQYCEVCKAEPASNFHDPDPWDKNPQG